MILVCHNFPYDGCAYHRLITPFNHIKSLGYAIMFIGNRENITRKFLIDNDIKVFWYSRNISPVYLDPEPLFKLLKSLKIKIVMDLDDFWEIPHTHVLHKFYKESNYGKCQADQAYWADYIIVTHQFLKDKILKKIRVDKNKIIIAANGIDKAINQYSNEKVIDSYKLKNIFYQGSITHKHDLKQIAPTFKELGLKLNIAGYSEANPETIREWNEIGDMFGGVNFIYSKPVTEYMSSYEGMGLCVIPLERNDFNYCKSNLKLLESGFMMRPVIVSGIHPYTPLAKHGKNCLMAYSPNAWESAFRLILNEPKIADDLRYQLYEDVQAFTIDKVNIPRIDLIDKLLK